MAAHAHAHGTDEKRKLHPKAELKEVGPCRVQVTVELDAKTVSGEIEEKFRELAEQAELPGFRKGHAPRPVLERKFGKAILDDLKFELLNSTFEEVREEKAIEPLGEPEVDAEKIEVKAGAPFTYVVTVEVRPKVEIKTYTGLAVKKAEPKVEESEIEEELKGIRESRAELAPTDGPAAAGDQITYDYELLAGGKSREKGQNQALFLTETISFYGVPMKDFHKSFAGKKAGDQVDVEITLPADHPEAELRGAKAVLRVAVKSVKQRKLPALDDAFAKALDMDSLADLRADLSKQILRAKEREAKAEQAKEILDQILKANPFPLPEGLIAANEQEHLDRMRTRLLSDGADEKTVEAELAKHGKESRPEVERHLRERFVLEHVAAKEKIFVTEDQLDERITQMAARSGHHPAEMRTFLENQGLVPQLRRSMREEAVLEFLVSKAKVG